MRVCLRGLSRINDTNPTLCCQEDTKIKTEQLSWESLPRPNYTKLARPSCGR